MTGVVDLVFLAPSMDRESLYWFLSTMSQVGAALVAFIGFLALSAWDRVLRRRVQVEEWVRNEIIERKGNVALGKFSNGLSDHQILTMSGPDLMNEVSSLIASPESRGYFLIPYYQVWRQSGKWISEIHRLLVFFTAWNLFMVLVTLSLIAYVENLEGIPYMRGIGFAVAVSMVASAVIMVQRALHPPEFYGGEKDLSILARLAAKLKTLY